MEPMDVLLCCAHHFNYPLSTSWKRKDCNAGYRPLSTCSNLAEKWKIKKKKKSSLQNNKKKSKFKLSALEIAGKLFL